MKKSTFTFLFSFLFLFAVQAQDHTIVLSGITFSPDNLTINMGETVEWDNQDGTHNVNGSAQSYPDNPEGFSNGSAAAAPWMFSHTFTLPGTYNYHCDPHFGVGMTGIITVLAAPVAGDVIITEINYNNPSTDNYEFLELYNKGSDAVDMTGWTVSEAVNFTFPAFTLNAGEYIVLVNDAYEFGNAFPSVNIFEFTGAINNTGETIILSNASAEIENSVSYSSSSPWPSAANGNGPSLSLCDINSNNNDPFNWAASITPTGFEVNGTEILATPGAANECPLGPVIGFQLMGVNSLENAGNVFAAITLSGGNANATEVTLEMNLNSTAVNGDDFTATFPLTVTFTAGASLDTQIISVTIIDDSDIESTEVLFIDLTNPTNQASIGPNNGQFALTILDNDTPLTDAMVISGIFDTHPAGAGAKGIELQALTDIPDISIFGVGSANNGLGSDGLETPLPSMSVTTGDCIYVTDDSLAFIDFFGFSPTIEGGAANINGDDAIELFENNIVIDVFGDINTDGTGEPWEHLDGWAYRISGTGPDGNVFQLGNWTFSGNNVFDDVPNNASAPVPFPTCTYSPVAPTMPVANDDNVSTPINTAVTINILGNDVTPNSLTTMTIVSGPDNGDATVNGLNDITYTPDMDFCGTDGFTYEICDMNGCSQAMVNITVECPVTYPPYSIDEVTTVNADGTPDSLGTTCQLQGIVHGIDFQGNDNILFTLIDATGGISLFSPNNFGYTVTEGDELIAQGVISEFSCLTEIRPDTLWVVSQGNALVTPLITTTVKDEIYESELVQLTNLTFVNAAQWLGDGSSFNVDVTNGTFTNTMRIDSDTELSSMPVPQEPFHAIGLGGQNDTNGICDEGYQFFPRYKEDIIELDNAKESYLASQIAFYPNPASDRLSVETELEISAVTIFNVLGQMKLKVDHPGNALDVSKLQPGVYLLSFQVAEETWTAKFMKQ